MIKKIKQNPLDLLLQAQIETKIFLIRGKRVMLDRDLANLYGVPTKVFKVTICDLKKRTTF